MLKVEDGSGMADADAYLSAVSFKNYADAIGFDYEDYSDDEIEEAIRRSTVDLDGRYRGRWKGRPSNGRTQALAWPRNGVTDGDGNLIDADTMPREIALACAELTRRELVDPNSLTPDTSTQRILSESVGPISTTYANEGDQRPRITQVEQILSGLIASFGTVTQLRF